MVSDILFLLQYFIQNLATWARQDAAGYGLQVQLTSKYIFSHTPPGPPLLAFSFPDAQQSQAQWLQIVDISRLCFSGR
jgi:hypothetical protein